MKLVLASNNAGKLHELQAMFAGLRLELIAQSELQVTEADEPFHTFVENALAKARHAAQVTGLPALADDAGLCIDAWGGQPGVDTANFCMKKYGLPKSNENNVTAILQAMQGETERGAAMVSTLVALRSSDDPEPLIAVGRVRGVLTQARSGEQGFGLDPIFYLPELGRTFAQLSEAEKNGISHRGRSAQRMRSLIQEHWL